LFRNGKFMTHCLSDGIKEPIRMGGSRGPNRKDIETKE